MRIRRLDTGPLDVSPVAAGRLLTPEGERRAFWQIAEEMPVAILLNGETFAVMMMTPADIEDFAVGFALTEGIVEAAEDIESLRIAEAADGMICNLTLDPARIEKVEGRRRTLAGRAGCGICGAQSLEAVLPAPRRVARTALPGAEALFAAFDGLPARQVMKQVNKTTHAAAFCDRGGAVELVREDIGRHNALDKLAGALARDGRDASRGFVLLSSRVSVEMVQKAAAIGAPLVAAVSAPSALALRVAARAGIVLACRAGRDIMLFDDTALTAPLKED
ncbi:formate dehydrogenase accessory sulfurtransferase FdhD [Amaricoccus solimangrovi]|uniref:Sulfur carrier protein FdhD n=1 Tax=Amaricoccus solimangrovi TaxID=2589815 RepID=A0A501WMW2_9RHOB|nr:formate dehydrogenase accessory sulfurtransferase FdhD [Amaricoccus solimangrovi]TPE50779.1 formate dehydrogenase accessory sulfurtransferase FdhD [Amaricoccus solimangrovi]